MQSELYSVREYYDVHYYVRCCFFFFKQKTAYEMRISDWSSDVCSSDLIGLALAGWVAHHHAHYIQEQLDRGGLLLWVHARDAEKEARALEILREQDRKSVV